MRGDNDSREILRSAFCGALVAVRGDRLAEAALAGEENTHVIALGKAGEAFAAGAWRALQGSLEAGLLLHPEGYATAELPPAAPFERHVGTHPIPDASSLEAGVALLDFAEALPRDAHVAVLLSGGASASVEVLNSNVDLEFLRRANRWLLASELPIEAINRVRAGLSRLKGGGLAQALAHTQARAWVLSDVTNSPLEWVGGGMLAPLPTGELPALPDWLVEKLTPSATVSRLPIRRLAGNSEAVAAVVDSGAQAMGALAGEAAELGRYIGRTLSEGPPGLFVWGGEPAVRLPQRSGRGGRCQQLALAAALEIVGRVDCCLLAASTDGWDGTDPIAGACVDGDSVARGEANGPSARQSLTRADAGNFLKASGDLIRTGPTGTHVNDLVIACKV